MMRRRLAMLAMLAMALPAGTAARAAEFALAPGQQVVGQLGHYRVKPGDLFVDIAHRFDVGYTALAAANPGVDPWVPGAGQEITIPTIYVLPDAPHHGIVVNLAQWRLYYFPPGGKRVATYPLGLGVIGRKTPLGETRIVRKEVNPAWYPPPSIRSEEPNLPAVIPAGPDNPLGAFALHLGWKNYLIHGTNKPDGVGRNVSHGCIRLYPNDIARLFAAVRVGTPVRVVSQPATVGWRGDALLLQVYPSRAQVDEIDTERPVTPDPAIGVEALVAAAAGGASGDVDVTAVDVAAHRRSGLAVQVDARSPAAPSAAEASAVAEEDQPAAGDKSSEAFIRNVIDPLIRGGGALHLLPPRASLAGDRALDVERRSDAARRLRGQR